MNEGKINEMRQLLSDLRIELVDLRAYAEVPVIVEDGETFAQNARKKAQAIAAHTGEWTLADDSGLEVAVLGGAPGVYSARYAGVHGDDAANVKKLLDDLKDVPIDRREARFVCALALASPDGRVVCVEGECRGMIGFRPKGENGFGYDPIFFVVDRQRMMAELTDEEKNLISHRAHAVKKLRPLLQAIA